MPPKKPIQSTQKGKTVANKKQASVNKPVKSSVPPKATSKTNKPEVKKTQKPTKETMAAKVMQRCVRTYLRKCRAINKEKKRVLYEAEMDRLEKEAYVRLAKAEQEEIEREYLQKEAELRLKKAKVKRIKRMLEASFDGEIDEIMNIFDEVKKIDDDNNIENEGHGKTLRKQHLLDIIECEDANNNTPLSEASSGGDPDTIRLLLSLGADPNTIGHFRRTPLYRAAFAGHHEACELLLESGADPRITAEDNQTPLLVSSMNKVQEVLSAWDITQTDILIEGISKAKEERSEMNKSRMQDENDKLEDIIEKCDENYKRSQQMLCKARQEYEKRIKEHDLGVAEGYAKPENTIQQIKDSETHLVLVELEVSKALEALQMAKLKHREQKAEHNKEAGIEELFAGITINIRELDDVLMRDVGDKMKLSNRYPLLIDISGQSSVFLRYRDTNYLNVLQQKNMNPEIIRKALLGAIRYGKYMVLDTMDVNMYNIYSEVFDLVQPNLLESILNQSFVQQRELVVVIEGAMYINKDYLKLIKTEDGEEYNKNNFTDENATKFKLVITTSNHFPEQILMDSCYPIKIIVSN